MLNPVSNTDSSMAMPKCRMLLTVIPLLLGLCACKKANQSVLKDTIVRPYEDELAMKPGKGYETVLEDSRGECIDFDEIGPTLGRAPGQYSQEAVYDLAVIEGQREFLATLDISSASQIKAVDQAGKRNASRKTRFSLDYSSKMNRYSVYVVAKVEIRNPSMEIKNPRLKEVTRSILTQGDAASIDKFRRVCGDSFMTGYTTGGEFFGVIEIKTKSDEHKISIKHIIETMLARDDSEAPADSQTSPEGMTFASRLKHITKNREFRIKTYQTGGRGTDVGLTESVDEMIARVKKFAEVVDPVSGAPAPYTATFQDYLILPEVGFPPEYEDELFDAQDVIMELAGRQAEIIALRGDIAYIAEFPYSFENVTEAVKSELLLYSKNLERLSRDIYRAGKKCQRSFRRCQVPESIQNFQPQKLPKRKKTLEQLKQEAALVITTDLESIQTTELRDHIGNGVDCFIEIRAVAPDSSWRRIRRTPSDFSNPRCDDLNKQFTLPLALLKEVFRSMGVVEDAGVIQVMVRDDDPGVEDHTIGSISKKYSEIVTSRGGVLTTLKGPFIAMEVGFGVR